MYLLKYNKLEENNNSQYKKNILSKSFNEINKE